MVKLVEMRRRVERLLAGDVRATDLSALYLALRMRSSGATSVKETGNFVAHAEEVDRGFVTDEAKDVFGYFRAIMPYVFDRQLQPDDMPPGMGAYLANSFRRLDSAKIREATGLTRKNAEANLRSALKNIVVKPNGREALISKLTREEYAIFNYTFRTITLRPLFTDKSIHRDFLFVLEKNGLLLGSERVKLKYLKDPLALFVLSQFNGVSVALDDDWKASLFLSLLHNEAIPGSKFLGVSIGVTFTQQSKWFLGGIAHPLIATQIPANTSCTSDLLAALEGQEGKQPSFYPIELKDGSVLSLI